MLPGRKSLLLRRKTLFRTRKALNLLSFLCFQVGYFILFVWKDKIRIKNGLFCIRNVIIMIRNLFFCIKKSTILIKNDLFWIRIIRFLIRNTSIFIRMKLFCIRKFLFPIKNRSFCITNTGIHVKIWLLSGCYPINCCK